MASSDTMVVGRVSVVVVVTVGRMSVVRGTLVVDGTPVVVSRESVVSEISVYVMRLLILS